MGIFACKRGVDHGDGASSATKREKGSMEDYVTSR
jgi:hypothetical protein